MERLSQRELYRAVEAKFSTARQRYMRLHLVLKVLVWIVGFVGVGGFVLVVEYFCKDQTVSVDIHPGNRCLHGGLKWMKDETIIPESWTLEGAAAQLRICDNTTVSAEKPDFPATLAQSYPGCIDIDEESMTLSLKLNVKAVCDDRLRTGYLCDGSDVAAQEEPDSSLLVQNRAELLNCTRGFFNSISKPK